MTEIERLTIENARLRHLCNDLISEYSVLLNQVMNPGLVRRANGFKKRLIEISNID
jgi:hypothetical protein